MISLPSFDAVQAPTSQPNLADALFGLGVDMAKISRILDYAEYCGNRMGVEWWTLRKPIPGHPKGSTVARQTLEKALFPASAGKYGAIEVSAVPDDFKAVESPGSPKQ